MKRHEEIQEKFKAHYESRFLDENWQKRRRIFKLMLGFIIILFGTMYLLKQMGFFVPAWILSWKTFFLALGFALLVKHQFKNASGYILIFIGGMFILKDHFPQLINTKLIWPITIIGIGVMIFLRALISDRNKIKTPRVATFDSLNSEGYINTSSIFGGVTKNVVSKNFQGATISNVFGGTELNLTQADFEGERTIDISCIFGGATLIIPSEWKVKSDLTSVFGGIDDKRIMLSSNESNENKVLVLKGTCIFGGIDLHSYK